MGYIPLNFTFAIFQSIKTVKQ